MPTQVLVNFLKTKGSKVEGNITCGAETGGEGEEAELMLAIICCLGRSTMGYCRIGGRAERDQWRFAMEENIWRDPHTSPDQVGTKQSA